MGRQNFLSPFSLVGIMLSMAESKVQLPDKPQYRSLASTAKNVRVMPYIMSGDPDVIDRFMKKNPPDIKGLLEWEPDEEKGETDIFVVGVRRIMSDDYLEYENRYGRSLTEMVNTLLCVFYAGSKLANPELDERPMPDIDVDEERRITSTPFGKMHGSLERNIYLLCGFLLSRCGRIVGVLPGSKYDFDPVSEDEVLACLDPKIISEFFPDGKSIFFDILEMAGVYDPEEIERRIKASGGELDADKGKYPDLPINEVGNSPSPSDEGSSTATA